jgi:NADH:ubiquinone oxidoreductase subunit D
VTNQLESAGRGGAGGRSPESWSTNLQSMAAMCEGGQVADVIVAVAGIDPVMGGVDR